ncbi:SUMO-targeted ubiquitin ligase complex subunit slx8 [Arachnomyces sp. PD_36]|nr:SUMO-targeted ubiquitin ligase complex subunit slx8 [Arachnomyces sp. PD_36]
MNNRSTPVVDLTSNSASSPPAQPAPQSHTAHSHTAATSSAAGHRRNSSIASISEGDFRGSKRRRHDNNTPSTVAPSSSTSGTSLRASQAAPVIESVDLTEVDETSPLSKTLAKQREDAIKAQETISGGEKKGRSVLTSYKCPVCMDTPVDATSTTCGKFTTPFEPFVWLVKN